MGSSSRSLPPPDWPGRFFEQVLKQYRYILSATDGGTYVKTYSCIDYCKDRLVCEKSSRYLEFLFIGQSRKRLRMILP